jgi:Domain of unknown function (DUF1707)
MDTDARGFPTGDIRVSDADRDRALAELSVAFQAGRLTAEELDERSGEILASRTGKELTALLADLPVVAAAPAALPPVRRTPPSGVIAGAAVAASCFAIVAVHNALSQGPSAQQIEQAREMAARLGFPFPANVPINPGVPVAATVVPAVIAGLLFMLVIVLATVRRQAR